MSKCEHGLKSRECYVCMSPMRGEQVGSMDRDTIIRLAEECGIPEFDNNESQADCILNFAALIASLEREQCAKVCETEWSTDEEKRAGRMFANEIRSRT